MGAKAEYLFDNVNEEAFRLLIVKAHNLYMFFSKYEHLGVLSLPLMMRQYDEKNRGTIFRQLVEAIMVIGHTMELCIRIWDQFNVETDIIFQSYIHKFEQHRARLLQMELSN